MIFMGQRFRIIVILCDSAEKKTLVCLKTRKKTAAKTRMSREAL